MTNFSQKYDATIRTLDQKLSELIDEGQPFDFTRSGDVLTIEFENGKKIVITPQALMEQLWISANYPAIGLTGPKTKMIGYMRKAFKHSLRFYGNVMGALGASIEI